MPHFRYKAVSANGTLVKGQLNAGTREVAIGLLQEKQLVVLMLEGAENANPIIHFLTRELGAKTLKSALIAEFIKRLALLVEAGVTLEAGLGLLAGSEGNDKIKNVAAALLKKLRDGAALADAMAGESGSFTPLIVAMVRAGESSGKLAMALNQLANHLARAETIRQSLRSALIYPIALLVVALTAIVLVLTVVLPQLEPIFADARDQAPLPTRFAFALSALVREYWWVICGALAIFFFAVRSLLKAPNVRTRVDRAILRTPILGMTLRRAESGRFARVLGTLLLGGVPLASALVLAQPVFTNRAFSAAGARITTSVREGGALTIPLARVEIFPTLVVQMVQIGEATGRLEHMLPQLADILETEVQRTIDRSVALLVPTITVTLGALVAGIIGSVMVAILGINDLAK